MLWSICKTIITMWFFSFIFFSFNESIIYGIAAAAAAATLCVYDNKINICTFKGIANSLLETSSSSSSAVVAAAVTNKSTTK